MFPARRYGAALTGYQYSLTSSIKKEGRFIQEVSYVLGSAADLFTHLINYIDDPFWEAVDFHYWPTADIEWYDPSQVTTQGGSLVFNMVQEFNHNMNFKSGAFSFNECIPVLTSSL